MSISPKIPSSAGYPGGAAIEHVIAEPLRDAQRPNAGKTGAVNAGKAGVGATTSSSPFEGLLQPLMDVLQACWGTARSKGNDNDGVVNRRNAPALYEPEGDASSVDMMLRMWCLVMQSHENSASVTKESLELRGVRLEKNLALRTDKLKEINVKTADDSVHEKSAKVWSWVGKIAAVIGAVAAVIVTGAGAVASGGAGTVLLTLSVMALINATLSFADEVSQSNGGPEISVANAINHTVVPVFETLGIEHDTAQKIAIGIAAVPLFVVEPQMFGSTVEEACKLAGVSKDTAKICGQVAVAAASIVVGVVGMGTSLAGASGVAALSSIAGAAYRLLQSSARITTAVASGVQGFYKISSAMTMRDVAYLEADRTDLATGATMLRKQMDINQETLKNLLEYIQNAVRAAAQIIKDLYDSQSYVTRNISQRSPV